VGPYLVAAATFALAGCSPGVRPAGQVQPDSPPAQPASQISVPKTDFDGNLSFELLKKQVAFGPRVPGSAASVSCGDWMEKTLKSYTKDVQKQPFTGKYKGSKIFMTNYIVRFNPEAKTQVVLTTHWDCRPTANEDVKLENRNKPIDGANDGASGVAVMMELTRVFGKRPPTVGVTMVFSDGEDLGPEVDNMLLGCRYWAKHQIPKGAKYGILLDMIGKKDVRIPVEPIGYRAAPEVVKKVYTMAERLGLKDAFPFVEGDAVEDDHVPMIEAGVPTIDLIDFDYPYWHTLGDTVDKCSADSLRKVGTVIEAVLRQEL